MCYDLLYSRRSDWLLRLEGHCTQRSGHFWPLGVEAYHHVPRAMARSLHFQYFLLQCHRPRRGSRRRTEKKNRENVIIKKYIARKINNENRVNEINLHRLGHLL